MWLARLYLLNVALLIAHEIDAAYWLEWRLFGLPGGNQAFVAAHIPLIVLVIWGYERLRANTRTGNWLSLTVCFVGLFALASHAMILIIGRPEFREPGSMAILAAIGVVSGFQIPQTMRRLRRPRPVAAPAPGGEDMAGVDEFEADDAYDTENSHDLGIGHDSGIGYDDDRDFTVADVGAAPSTRPGEGLRRRPRRTR